MERWTSRDESGYYHLRHIHRGKYEPTKKDLIQRVGQYEDTGLEPNDVTDLMAAHGTAIGQLAEYRALGPIDHLRNLVQAERDGRLVVLPCYTGDKVYIPLLGKILELEVGTIVLNGGVTTIYYYSSSLRSSPDDFGKSVFLSRTEAEAALEDNENGL